MPRHDRNPGEQGYSGFSSGLPPSSMYPTQPLPNHPSYFAAPSASGMPIPSQLQTPHQQPYEPYSNNAVSSTLPMVSSQPSQHRPSSGAWSQQDDQKLLQARMQGLNWNQIKDQYFESKTPNACRKRHERLMERRGSDDWDARKTQNLAKEYMGMRKEIWSGLAARTGEKWNVVEAKCMSNGLKNLQSAARAASRRDRLETGASTGYDDDSGISGIGLTPVDELDPSYSSPATSSSGTHSYSSSASYHHQQHLQPQHHQNSYAMGAATTTTTPYYGGHGYSSSVSSSASFNHRQDSGPYGDSQRFSTERPKY